MRPSHLTELTSRPALIGPASLGRETRILFGAAGSAAKYRFSCIAQHQMWGKLLPPPQQRVLYGLLTFFRKKGLSPVWWKLGAQVAQKGRD